MFKYLTVFNAAELHEDDENAKGALLLFYEFEAINIRSISEKLNCIGVIKGIWQLSQSLNPDGTPSNERIVELDGYNVCAILVEEKYYICIAVEGTRLFTRWILTQLWYSYKFFVLKNGYLHKQVEKELSGLLNEHMIIFWKNISLKSNYSLSRLITMDQLMDPDTFKTAELFDNAFSDDMTTTWDSIILKEIILNETNYLGLKDIIVYNLPKQQDRKQYGYLRHFNQKLQNINDLSNWIYHLDSIYDGISSHVLSGNVHYREIPTIDSNADNNNKNINNMNTNNNSNLDNTTEEQPLIDQNDGNNNENNNQQGTTLLNNISTMSNNLLHNLTLPISFAYDAIQEVGNTTGVSSLSYLKNYVPSWSNEPANDNNNNNGNGNYNNNNNVDGNITNSKGKDRFGFLLSTLASDELPTSYKFKKLYLNYDNDFLKPYFTMFWYYNDMLLIIVFETAFDKLWDKQYLKQLNLKLAESMGHFYKSLLSWDKIPVVEQFVYYINEKTQSPNKLKTSIPIGKFNDLQNNTGTTNKFIKPFELAINGMDQILFNQTKNLGLDNMGNLFKNSYFWNSDVNEANDDDSYNNEENNAVLLQHNSNSNFLMSMSDDKLLELQDEIFRIITSLQESNRDKTNIDEERLLTLNNGVLCYIRDDEKKLVVIIKNWFEFNSKNNKSANNKSGSSMRGERTLFDTLGKDVRHWWDTNNAFN